MRLIIGKLAVGRMILHESPLFGATAVVSSKGYLAQMLNKWKSTDPINLSFYLFISSL